MENFVRIRKTESLAKKRSAQPRQHFEGSIFLSFPCLLSCHLFSGVRSSNALVYTFSSLVYSLLLLFNMSFNFDDEWDALGLHSPRASPTSGLSGELEGLSGGGAKSVLLFFVDAVVDVSVCWGLVGSGKVKFCIKPCLPGTSSCGTMKHEGLKFAAKVKTFYIRSGDSQALCSPCLPTSGLSKQQRDALMGIKHTASEWASIFDSLLVSSAKATPLLEAEGLLSGDIEGRRERSLSLGQEGEVVDLSETRVGDFLLESPKLVSKNVGIFEKTPVMPMSEALYSSVRLEDAKEEWEASNIPGSLIHYLAQIHDQLCLIKEGWPAPFRDIEGSFMLMTSDLERIQETCRQLQVAIGVPEAINGRQYSSLWGGLKQVVETTQQSVQALRLQLEEELAAGLRSNMGTLQDLEKGHEELVQASASTAQQLQIHSRRFEQIKPFLVEFNRIFDQAAGDASDLAPHIRPVQEELNQLRRRVEQVEIRAQQHSVGDS